MFRRLATLAASSVLAALVIVAPAAPASAAVLTSGDPVTATVAVPGGTASYTFAGVSGEHITFDVSSSSWGGGVAYGNLYNPSGGYVGYFSMSSSATFGDFTLNATGTWTIVIDPSGSAVGAATFTYAVDLAGGALTSGVAVTTAIGFRGQNARYTFSGTAGEHVTFDASSTSWGGGVAYVELYNPTGGYLGYFSMSSSATFGDFTLNATGTWTAVVNPSSAATGAATIAFARDILGGSLTPDTAVTTAIGFRGQNARYTFSGTAGEHVTFDASSTSWGGGVAYVELYNPTGGYLGYFTISGSATFGDFTLNATGTWTVVINPSSAAMGSVTLTFARDILGGSLTSGTAVTTAIGFRGQNARYTFSGTSGEHVTFDASSTSWGGGIAYVELYNPTGGYLGYFTISGSATYGDFTLNATGTWTAVINPNSAATGSVTLTLGRDILGGSLTPAVPVTTTIGLRGQNARYTLSGTSGQHIRISASSTYWGGGQAYVELYNPTGGYLGYFTISGSATYGDFTLNATGTWTVLVNPNSAATGSATLSYL
ncbi:hypothetical protein F4553_001723 [Allocatelliglobosispora scoriae]|uniref:Uncharacterized protein n=1 Tax=Allocatelliglobosispora scoriae TaxID=643052 RepID=A0A841BJB0_9ACTN|nr:hypothetical protein [Allocatelliglobosispora scoriae]MBB5868344.1 hypothetical protein [Allocatelliglobosispora scoriae]